ncbi:type 1 glutamine amidotransferase [Streptomyces sp. NPDC004539]|uniref:type 1 glutamine amidotransferase n=1 Tax=Streptomyces sp. NPDC004539 TaxID=3154280 RepID=UPI0033AF68B2
MAGSCALDLKQHGPADTRAAIDVPTPNGGRNAGTSVHALVIAHDSASSPGPVGDRLAERGYTLDVVTVVPEERFADPAVRFDFPDLSDYRLVVALGAPWSVYDDASVGTWIEGELGLLRAAHAADVPVLGICFGAQALATALGGAVARSPEPEIGWFTVESERPDLIASGPWFQWHFDRFTVPPEAQCLARSTAGPQAFRIGRALGVQFHPEITEKTLDRWLELGGAAQAERHGVDPMLLVAETRLRREESSLRAHRLVDTFLDHVALV